MVNMPRCRVRRSICCKGMFETLLLVKTNRAEGKLNKNKTVLEFNSFFLLNTTTYEEDMAWFKH